MTEEDKKLLLKDLSARFAYGVKIALKNNGSYHHENVAKKGDITIERLKGISGNYFNIYHDNPLDWDWYESDIVIEDIKPYLFPLSSISKKQMEELKELCNMYTPDDDYHPYAYKGITVLYKHVLDEDYEFSSYFKTDVIDWFNENHFDYRGLIERGLAIDATGKKIY